jgi:hypothetical protein
VNLILASEATKYFRRSHSRSRMSSHLIRLIDRGRCVAPFFHGENDSSCEKRNVAALLPLVSGSLPRHSQRISTSSPLRRPLGANRWGATRRRHPRWSDAMAAQSDADRDASIKMYVGSLGVPIPYAAIINKTV